MRVSQAPLVLLSLLVVTAHAREGELPFDLAFDRTEFSVGGVMSLSASGRHVAYEVQNRPNDVDLSGTTRYQENGTPTGVLGTRIDVTEVKSGKSERICPQHTGQMWRPSWSPVEEKLVFYADTDGKPQLWMYERASGQCRKVSDALVRAKLWAGDEAQWSPDGRTVYVPTMPATPRFERNQPEPGQAQGVDVLVLRSAAAKQGDAPIAPAAPDSGHFIFENNAAVAAIDVSTGTTRIVAPADANPLPSVMRVSASGKWVSYLSVIRKPTSGAWKSVTDLAVVSAQGGKVHSIAAALPSLHDLHRRNYSWHPQRDLLVYIQDRKLWLVTMGEDGPQAPRQIGEAAGPLGPTINWFSEDGNSVIVGIEPVEHGNLYFDADSSALAAIPLDGGPITKLTYDDKWKLYDVIKSTPRTVWQPDKGTVTAVMRHRSTTDLAIMRLGPRSGESKILWTAPARVTNVMPVAQSRELLVAYEDLKTPLNLHAFSSDFSRRRRVTSVEPRLDAVKVGNAEVFESVAPSYDGTLVTLRSAVLLPPGAKRGDKLPAIVMMYPDIDLSGDATYFGGGGYPGEPPLIYTSRGYAVLLTNADMGPGGTNAGDAIDEIVDSVLPQVYRAAELGYIDIRRLALRGQSAGAYGTAAIVSRTNLFRAAVPSNGPYDLGGIYGRLYTERFPINDESSPLWMSWVETGGPRVGTHPWANVFRYIENSPYYRADKIKTPMLIMQGSDDTFVTDAEKLYSALKRLDRPVELAIYKGGGHAITTWFPANAADATRRMLEFFRKHIGEP
ncbi:S9 family peptidase [Peristeroidobacter soli]|uniref:S9 family peptidase n=1 Tax=Peristeroidobacter soli TaxID=2497877 RepID=UPI00101C51B6|nr:prolyl oligopeptidase family serine peptidase [Peristeroidobacter soli]